MILTSEVVFMTTLMACVYEKVIYVDFDQLETDGIKNIESLWWLVRSTQSSWFTAAEQRTLTLFFWVIKWTIFDWNCCADMGSEGKKINKSLGDTKYTHFLANSGHF